MNVVTTMTGRIRHRVHKTLWGKELLVMQVELRHKGRTWLNESDHAVDYTTWQDANVQHISIQETK